MKKIFPSNELVTDHKKYDALLSDMKEHRWRGKPLAVIHLGTSYEALNGSHRIHAANAAGISIPFVALDATKHLADKDGNCTLCNPIVDAEHCVINELLSTANAVEHEKIARRLQNSNPVFYSILRYEAEQEEKNKLKK